MLVYLSNAALLCNTCGQRRIDALLEQGVKDNGDYDTFPQGPYGDGGGESDSPNHCDVCNVFLENPLTSDGYAYVANAIDGRLNNVTREWAEFYLIAT